MVAVSLIKLLNRICFMVSVSVVGYYTECVITVAVSIHRICYYDSRLRKLISVCALVYT
jgi:hypothetical protein